RSSRASASATNFAAASVTVIGGLAGSSEPDNSIAATFCAATCQFVVPKERRTSLPLRWPLTHKGHLNRCLGGQGLDSESSPQPFRCLGTTLNTTPKP